ncbi:fasciclin domain protein [Rhizoctonia solani AG-3 Rhs1AP]|uniref:Fasciclin domain protein n=2 Tax=Rhizoctonia solani AG-3 TaxID=1086053 RepID=A0A074RV86_9AGAM|nr:fasciclin domain protein [Rhizoctonia solani AG-3 Rhs1AP]KEP50814.1 fasciclin domain protein [Rhizoctonia solani 123E]
MLFLARVVPALLAASSLVQAASVVSRTNDDFLSGFLETLCEANLTILADNYKRIAETKEGKLVIDSLEKGGDITLLAPENCAFDSDHPKLDANVLLYNALQGNIDSGFKSNTKVIRRDGAAQSHSVVESQAGISGGGARKRQGPSYQVQTVDQTFAPNSRKRWSSSSIQIGQAVGTAKFVKRITYKKIIILVIDTLLSLPGGVSDLLCKPLINGAPDGFSKFSAALKKADLLDEVENGKQVTIFVPIDDSFGDNDNLSKDDLSCFLKNHVIYGKRVFSPLFRSISDATAASGKQLKFTSENGMDYVCCGKNKSMVLRSDVISGNGVLHVIDKPLKCD